MLIVWKVKGGMVREPAKLGSISPLPITGQGWTKEVDFAIIKQGKTSASLKRGGGLKFFKVHFHERLGSFLLGLNRPTSL